ncbi:MAG: heme ABC exporter ATP-binding protein CcmA [Alphaproteobacteria bacterium]|nr:MAG: heme ABC exporter ATP-binding protein CcmA [Alphaproteobacteria bacterium]
MDFLVSDISTDILSGQGLTCIRGDKPIFSDLAFELAPGQALILNGTNGSGKSSLMKIIAGLLPAEHGTMTYGGEAILGDRDWISHNICYLAHKNGMKPELTVAENLAFWATMEHHDGDIAIEAAKIGIDHCLDLPVCYLSSGQARRAALTRVLCHPGKFWLLDEPTVGLDTAGVELLAGLMNDHLKSGGRILAATHIELGIDPDKSIQLNMSDFSFTASYDPGEDLLC